MSLSQKGLDGLAHSVGPILHKSHTSAFSGVELYLCEPFVPRRSRHMSLLLHLKKPDLAHPSQQKVSSSPSGLSHRCHLCLCKTHLDIVRNNAYQNSYLLQLARLFGQLSSVPVFQRLSSCVGESCRVNNCTPMAPGSRYAYAMLQSLLRGLYTFSSS